MGQDPLTAVVCRRGSVLGNWLCIQVFGRQVNDVPSEQKVGREGGGWGGAKRAAWLWGGAEDSALFMSGPSAGPFAVLRLEGKWFSE